MAINKFFPKYKSGSEAYIININSVVSLTPVVVHPHYSTSKSATLALTRSFGVNKTIAESGVYVMAICPGITDTPLLKEMENVIVYKQHLKEGLAQFVNIQKYICK